MVVQNVSSESESDALIYENVVEIKWKNKKNGTLGEVIQSNVNVGGQAKYLEIHTMFWDKQSSCFFLEKEKYPAESPDSMAQHTSSVINVTQVKWDWHCRSSIVLWVWLEAAFCGHSYYVLGFTVTKLRNYSTEAESRILEENQARIKTLWHLGD